MVIRIRRSFPLLSPTGFYIGVDVISRVLQAMESPFTHTTRVVTCVPEADGFALGSVEGRVALQYVARALLSHLLSH